MALKSLSLPFLWLTLHQNFGIVTLAILVLMQLGLSSLRIMPLVLAGRVPLISQTVVSHASLANTLNSS